ncbi:MAG TPA: FHA domain-containing protein [Planctomycetota bacterium]|nr:FHA domain-containing protein [Planctomycetota bacterium]
MTVMPRLVGVSGHVAGEELALEYGKKVTIGRSRSADWSLVRLKAWTAKSESEREADDSFRTVSGRHFEITMVNLGSIELVNLSPNGTLLDGKPVSRVTLTDVATTPHEIRFGADEILRLEAKMQEDAAARPAASSPSDETKPQPPPPDAQA